MTSSRRPNGLRENGMVLARHTAAQCWCDPRTSATEMDPMLAEVFAETINEIWSEPWLGNATTKELLDEIAARVDLDYRTVGPEPGNADDDKPRKIE